MASPSAPRSPATDRITASTSRRGPVSLPGAAGIGLSFGAIGVYLAGQLLLQLLMGIGLVGTGLIGPELLDPEEGGAALLGVVVASQTVGLILAVVFVRWRGVRLRPLIGAVQPAGRLLATGVGLGLLAIVGSSLIVSLLVSLSGSEATPEQVLTGGIADTPLQLILAIVAAVVLAPIAEELLFRGLLHRGLRRRMSLLPATVISSVVFAVVHVDVLFSQPLAIVGLVLVGVILALAYERTGSLIVPIVIHAVHNAVTIAAVVATSRFGIDAAGTGLGILVGGLGVLR
jgi:membrane protease YdiL (CAAX protease family)